MNLDKNNMKKIMLLITFTLVLAMALFNIKIVLGYASMFLSVLTPFIIGGAMAFVVNLPMKAIEKYIFRNKFNKIARPISLVLSFVFILLIIAIVLGVVVPDLYTTISSVSGNIKNFLPKVYDFTRKYVDNTTIREYVFKLQDADWLGMLNGALNIFTTGAGNVISTTVSMVSSVIDITVNIVIALVFCIYILLQKESLIINSKRVLKVFIKEKVYNYIIKVLKLTNTTFSNYVTGQCLDAFILGVMFFVVLLVIGIPYPLLIAVLVGFTALIPLIGAFIGCIISVFLIVMISPADAIIFLIIFIILQQVDENLVYPKVVGDSISLPSIWVLVAVIIGGSLWGVLGMILFIPLFSVAYNLFGEYVDNKSSQNSQKFEDN